MKRINYFTVTLTSLIILFAACKPKTTITYRYIDSDKVKDLFKMKSGSYYIYKNLKNNLLDSVYCFTSTPESYYVLLEDPKAQIKVETRQADLRNADGSLRMIYWGSGQFNHSNGAFAGILMKNPFYNFLAFNDPYLPGQSLTTTTAGMDYMTVEGLNFYDSLVVNSISFYNVHHLKSTHVPESFPADTFVTESYFSETQGLIKWTTFTDTLLMDYEVVKYHQNF